MNVIILALIILTLFSRIVGFGRDLVLARFFGASITTDAYLMSIAIPTILMTVLLTAFSQSFVPVYQKQNGTLKDKQSFFNQTLLSIFVLGISLAIFIWLFTPALVSLLVTGFSPEAIALTTTFTRITSVAVIFMGISQLLQSFMQVSEKVLLASLSGLPFNAVAILFIIVGYHHDYTWLAIGTLIALFAQMAYLVILVHRVGHRFSFRFFAMTSEHHALLLLGMPIMLGLAVEQLGIMVDKNMISSFGEGAISAFSFSTRTTTAISGIIVSSFLVVTFPKIAKEVSLNQLEGMKKSLSSAIVTMSLFIIPAAVAIFVLATPVVTILFGRGAFDEYAISMTADLLRWFVFYLVGHGLSLLFSRTFFALGDSKTPFVVALLTVVTSVTLNMLLVRFMGISGIAFSSSIASFVGLFSLIWLLKIKLKTLALGDGMFSIFKITVASLAMVVVASLFNFLFSNVSAFIGLAVAALTGGFIYLILILIFDLDEVNELLHLLQLKISGTSIRK